MNRYRSLDDNDNRRRGLWLSIIIHIVLFMLLLFPYFNGNDKVNEDQLQGIVVDFGNPDAEYKTPTVRASVSTPRKSSTSTPVKATPPKASEPVKSASTAVKSKIVEDNSELIAAQKEAERKKLEDARLEAEAKKRAEEEAKKQAEAEARRQAEEEAKRRAEEEARQRAEQKANAKSKFSNMFKSGDDSGESSKGDENGKPNASALDNLSSGSGKVGSGLGSRELLHAPAIRDNTQKTGRVIINICVNSSGKVISAKFRQKGSTTTDAHLVRLAETSARQYVFSKSQIEEQCGDIIIDFKLR